MVNQRHLLEMIIGDDDEGEGWDDNGTWEEDEHDSHEIPVFYLMSSHLADLTGDANSVAEGYYAVDEGYEYDELIGNEVFGWWLEPVVQGADGEFLMSDDEDIDGLQIVNHIATEEDLKGYFDQSLGEPVGYIYYGEPTTPPGDDHWDDDEGEGWDDNGTWEEDEHDSHEIPVFYLMSSHLADLTGDANSVAEGYYAVDEGYEYDELIGNEVFGWWLEPVVQGADGEFLMSDDEDIDGLQIVNHIATEEDLKGYFDQSLGEPVGYIYYGEPTTPPGDDHWGDDEGEGWDDNGTFDEEEEWDIGDPVFYLSSENLQELTDISDLEAGNYAVSVEEYFDYATYYTFIDFKLAGAEEVDEKWQYSYSATHSVNYTYNNDYAIESYFESNGLEPVGFIVNQHYHPHDPSTDNQDDYYPDYPYEDETFSAPVSIEGIKVKLFITQSFDFQPHESEGFEDGLHNDPLAGYSQPYFEVVERILKIGKSHIVSREGNNDWIDSYSYHVDENTGEGILKLSPAWYNSMGDPDWNAEDLPADMPPLNDLHVLLRLKFQNYDYGTGEVIKPKLLIDDSLNPSSLSFYFEVVEYGWPIHAFDQSSLTELTGEEDAEPGNYILMWAGSPDGGVEGYLEPVFFNPVDERGFPYGQYEMTSEPEDWITVDTSKYPQYEPEEFIKDFEVMSYWFERDEWILPQKAADYLEENYRWDWGESIGYYYEFIESYDEASDSWLVNQISVSLDDGTYVYFDLEGNFIEDFRPWEPGATEFSLEFNPLGSSWGEGGTFTFEGQTDGSSPAFIDIREVSSSPDSAIFRVSLVNTLPENISGEEPSLEELDLSATDIPVGTEVNLTFNYDPYEPNLLYAGGAEVTGYKLRRGDWDNPNASFTITAETIAPVPSVSNPEGSIGSTLSFLVELGNEYKYYGGAIFQSNVVGLDIGTAQLSDPWSSTYNFSLNGLAGTDAHVRAILPKWGINDHLYIWEYFRVQAAVLSESGMNFIQGSRDFEDGTQVGSDFARTHLQGYEEPYYDLDLDTMGGLYEYASEYDPYHYEQSYALDDTLFGIDYVFDDYQSGYDLNSDYYVGSVVYYDGTAYTANDYVPYGTEISDSEYWVPVEEQDLYIPLPVVDDYYYEHENFEDENQLRARRDHDIDIDPLDPVLTGPIPFEETASKFDFDADGLADASLEISFNTNAFGDIQLGEPFYIPPPPSPDELVIVKGRVTDEAGNPIREFGVDAFKENNPNGPVWEMGYGREWHDIWEANFSEDGDFSLTLSPGQFKLEAWGWDSETGQGYKPSIYKTTNLDDRLFDLAAGDILEDINFTLGAEWQWPSAEGNITSSLNLPNGVDFPGGYIELWPIDESGNDLTDYNVFTVDIEHNGSISLKSGIDPLYLYHRSGAPVGLYRLVLNTWGLPMKLSGEPRWDIVEGENTFLPLEVETQETYLVRGSTKDESGNPAWGDIVFVDPEDESIVTWPQWYDPYMNLPPDVMVESVEDPDPGAFAFIVPEGNYKIRAENWSGIYEPTYYGGDTFDSATVVTIDQNISDINIVFSASDYVATINLTVLDENNNSVEGAWFDFFDAYDEWGFVQFPWVEEDGEGGYSLKIEPGDYKIQVAHWLTDDFLFMTRDDEGGYQWEPTSRERAGILSVSSGETYDLGTAILDTGSGPGPEPQNSISGSVLTREGARVPNAAVHARTTDYLSWRETETDRDGNYSLYDLPAGDWVLYAAPPFESDEFLGYFESDESGPHQLEDGSQLEIDNLILQGSNTSGRVLYSKKDKESGESKIKALSGGWIWVFEDEDQDGEPDYGDPFFDEDFEDYKEYFAYTDDNGFFSLYIDKPGRYSLIVEMEGQLSSYDQEPISFLRKDTFTKLRIGNTIKIDWAKNKVSPDKFDIKRRISGSSDNMKSLFSSSNDYRDGTNKLFMDRSIQPGKSYEYKVFAVNVGDDRNSSEALDLDVVKVSKPIIYFVPPKKSISGVVSYADSNMTKTVKGAEIVAWQTYGVGYASTYSGKNGKYELDLGPGEWEVTVYRPWDTKVDWYFEGLPKIVEFKDDITVQKRPSFNFEVTKQGAGEIKGSIALPEGVTYSQLSNFVWIDCFDPMGNGDWAQPDSNGSFSIPLKSGEYELSIWVDQWALPGVGLPDPKVYRVRKSAVDVGVIQLPTMDGNISGTLLSSDDKPLGEIEVWCWNDRGGWASDTTDKDGKYSLTVGIGSWEVGYTIPWNPDGSAKPFIQGSPKRVRITDSAKSKTVDFIVKSAGNTIEGIVLDSNNNPISNLDGWVYVKEYIEQDDETPLDEYFENYVADTWVDPSGRFSFPTASGTYLVGIWLPGESGYSAPADLTYRVDDSGELFAVSDSGEDSNKTRIEIVLNEVNSTLVGNFRKGTNNIKTFTGEVYAMRLDAQGWSSTNIKSDGSYKMKLPTGEWMIEYYVMEDSANTGYQPYPDKSSYITIEDGENTLNFDFSKMATLSLSLNGTVADESGSGISGAYVWVYREELGDFSEFWSESITKDDGSYSIDIIPGGKYDVGVYLTSELRGQNYTEPSILNVKVPKASERDISGVDFNLTKPSEDNYITGSILDTDGNPIAFASVYAWNFDGSSAQSETNSDGQFTLSVLPGKIWQVGAEYSEFNEEGYEIYYSAPFDLDIDLRDSVSAADVIVTIKASDFLIPEGISETFDPSKDFITVLPDGTEILIPGGASNVDESVSLLRLVVTPKAKGLAKSGTVKTADYGYSIELFTENGKKVEGNFKKDVVISVPVDIGAVDAIGLDTENLTGKYFSSTKNTWENAKTSVWDKNSSLLVMTTDHFSDYVIASTPNDSDLSKDSLKHSVYSSAGWFTSDWFGDFFDAGQGWIYQSNLGWLYLSIQDDEEETYWMHDSNHGWLWTGKSYFDVTDSSKSHFYSNRLGKWLYYDEDNGFWDFDSNSYID